MSDIPAFPYRLLWGERRIESVANLTRRDAAGFMAVASRTAIRTTTQRFGLASANDALDSLRSGRLEGAAVLVPGTT
jgi:propanol-preferring alcohol dehydrogenase